MALLQVHDERVFEAPEAERAIPVIKWVMEGGGGTGRGAVSAAGGGGKGGGELGRGALD